MRIPASLQSAINRRLLYWPPPDDEDFRNLSARATDAWDEELLAFYAEWLPTASGVAGASVRSQHDQTSFTEGSVVWLNAQQSLVFKTPTERLALVHAIMWHEAGHLRHPNFGSWLERLRDRDQNIAPRRLFAALQALEDLRVERELVAARPQAASWLRYQLGAFKGMVTLAVTCGGKTDCGWAMAATMTAGRAAAGIIDRDMLARITAADKRLAAQTSQLWELWKSYALLTDADRHTGEGDEQLLRLAALLPETI
jgi:hypothetical protein